MTEKKQGDGIFNLDMLQCFCIWKDVELDSGEYTIQEWSVNMIRYADERDFDRLRKYDGHVGASELKNSIEAGRVIVMFRDDEFIGWLRFNLFWDRIPFMNMLYILEGWRGKGNGRQLVDFWEKEMRSKKFKIVMTSTQSDERGQFFYRKNGYRDCGSLLFPDEPLEIILLKNLA